MDPSPRRPSPELKRLVKAVLSTEEGNRTPLKYFEETFRTRTNETFQLHWQDLNYASASECLEMMSDVCTIEKFTAPERTGSTSEALFVVLKESSDCGDGDGGQANASDNPPSDIPSAEKDLPCQDVRISTARRISEGSKVPGQSDSSRPSTPIVYVVLSFASAENPLWRPSDIRVKLYPHGLHNVTSTATRIFMYFRDVMSAMQVKKGVVIEISGCRIEKDLSRNISSSTVSHGLFSLSFPTSSNPTLKDSKVVFAKLDPYGVREVRFVGTTCYIRFDDKVAAMKLFHAQTGIAFLRVAEKCQSAAQRQSAGETLVARNDHFSSIPSAPSPIVNVCKPNLSALQGSVLTNDAHNPKTPEKSPRAQASSPKDASKFVPPESETPEDPVPRQDGLIAKNKTETQPPADLVTLMYTAQDNPELAERDAIWSFFGPLGLREINFHNGFVFIRFETDEAAEKIFQIEPPIEGLVKALSFRDRSSEVTLMYKARDNPTMADRQAIRFHLDPLGLQRVNFHKDWVFIQFGTEEPAKKVFMMEPQIKGLKYPDIPRIGRWNLQNRHPPTTHQRHVVPTQPAIASERTRSPITSDGRLFQSAVAKLHEGREVSVIPKSEVVTTAVKENGLTLPKTDHNHNAVLESSTEEPPIHANNSYASIDDLKIPRPAFHESQDLTSNDQSLSSLNTSIEPASSNSKIFNSSQASESTTTCSSVSAGISKSIADPNHSLSAVKKCSSPTVNAFSKAAPYHQSSPNLPSPVPSSPRGGRYRAAETKPQIEQFLSKESITEMSIHFLKALPRFTACPFTDPEIAEILVNATLKSSEKVVNASVTSLLRRVDAPEQGERSVCVNAVVRVKIKGSKEAFLERLWNVCCTNIPPLVEEMVPLFLHPANGGAPERMKSFSGYSLTSQFPFKTKGNSRALWKIFKIEQKDDEDEEELLIRILELGSLSNGLYVRDLEAANIERPALVLFVVPPMSRASDLVMLRLCHEENLANLTQIWEGVTEKSATEAFYEFKMTYGNQAMFKGLSSVSLASGNDSFPQRDLPILNMSNSEVDVLCQSSGDFKLITSAHEVVNQLNHGHATNTADNHGTEEVPSQSASDATGANSKANLNPNLAPSADLQGQQLSPISVDRTGEAAIETEAADNVKICENEPIVNLEDVLSKQKTDFSLTIRSDNTVTSYHLDASKRPSQTIIDELTSTCPDRGFAGADNTSPRRNSDAAATSPTGCDLHFAEYHEEPVFKAEAWVSSFNGQTGMIDDKKDVMGTKAGVQVSSADDQTISSLMDRITCRISKSPSKASIPDLYFQPYLSASHSDVAVSEEGPDGDEGAVEEPLVGNFLECPPLGDNDRSQACPWRMHPISDSQVGNLLDVDRTRSPKQQQQQPDISFSLTSLRQKYERLSVSVSTSATSLEDFDKRQNVCEVVSILRDKAVRWGGDIIPRQKTNLLSCESARSVPTSMTTGFLEEINRAYGEWPSFQHLPQMINFAVHEVEDGRRFWGQVAEEESLSALLRIHTVLREAAKVLSLTKKPPPSHGKCMVRLGKNQWYRGIIFKTHCDEDRRPCLHEVFFVDFGFCRQVEVSDVADLPLGVEPPMMPFLPPLALPFQLNGLQAMLKNRGKERLSSLILNRIVPCRVLPSTSDSNPRTLPKFSNNPHLYNAEVFLNDHCDDSVNDIMRI